MKDVEIFQLKTLKDECIEDTEETDMSTQFLRMQKNHLIDLKQNLERYVNTLPVFGFNSGRYDLNLIKSYLIPYLINDKEAEPMAIKKANDFISFKFGDIQFLDIMKFLGGATSLKENPTLQAMQKMVQFYHQKETDMLKLGCTLPNLANIFLHKSTNEKFYPFCESDRDLCEKIREDMTGGPSIVFTRKAVEDETFIRDSSNVCKSIGGIDASQFYPY